MERQIAVIDPAMNRAETDCFNLLVGSSPLPMTYHLPKLAGMDSLHADRGTIAGIIILGSACSVNDGFEWQTQMNAWLKPKLEAGIPTIGLCYGHQLLSHLFGAKVDFVFEDKRKHSGLRTVHLKKNRLWGEATQGSLVVSHREAVQTCPAGFEVVGASPEVAVDAIAHTRLPIWGFQSHPESSPSFLKSQGIAAETKSLEFGWNLMRAFLRFVADRR